jgi:hypothetical protein
LAVSFFVAEILGLSLLSYIFSGGRVPRGRGEGEARGRRKEGGAKDCESNIKASNKYYIGSRGLLHRLLNVYPVYFKKEKKTE